MKINLPLGIHSRSFTLVLPKIDASTEIHSNRDFPWFLHQNLDTRGLENSKFDCKFTSKKNSPKMKQHTLIQVVVAITTLLLLSTTNAISVKVEPRTEQCFYERIEKANTMVMVQYQVSYGGFLDIDVTVTSPDGGILHNAQRETEGKLSFVSEKEGDYAICFSNKMSTLTPKTIMFNVHVADALDPKLAKVGEKDALLKTVMRLSDGLQSVIEEQQFYKMREMSHRDMAEETNTKVVIWSIVEMIVIGVMSIFQVFFLRSFFSSKR